MPSCKCDKHDEISKELEFKVYSLHKGKKIKVAAVRKLIELNLLDSRSSALCTACEDYALKLINSEGNENQESKRPRFNETNSKTDELLKLIINKEISESDLLTLCKSIGENQRDTFQKYISENKNKYKDENYMTQFDLKREIGMLPPVVLTFLTALCGEDVDNMHHKCTGTIIKIFEHLASMCDSKYVGPLCFLENLITYFLSGSSQILDILNKFSPNGSYSTVYNWLNEKSKDPLVFTSKEDTICFFDNNQILSRNWRVKYNSKYSVSVVTTVGFFIPDTASSIQQNPELSPSRWLAVSECNGEIMQNLLKNYESYQETFSHFRTLYIKKKLEEVLNSYRDGKDDIMQMENDTEREKTVYNPYTEVINVPSSFTTPAEVIVGEPIMVNPCSYQSVEIVLDNLVHQLIKDGREWCIVGCDGLPYILASKIIQNYVHCLECQKKFKMVDEFNVHNRIVHNNKAHFQKTYQHIVLIPGLGHFEINSVKALFKLEWNILLLHMAKMLGLTSVRALTYCEQANNHHQSYQMLLILLEGTGKELLYEFVDHCRKHNIAVNMDTLHQFLKQTKSKNYHFQFESIFTYVLALQLYRIGIRRNYPPLINACRWKLSELFFGLNMTTYQEITYRDEILRSQLPAVVRRYVENHDSMSISGHTSKGEGGDFLLENMNRKIKKWMPPGVPNEKRWERVCRNVDRVEKLKTRVHDLFDADIIEEDCRKTDLTEEIKQWRLIVRKSKLLSDPLQQSELTTMKGEALDPDLSKFSSKCRSNRQLYFESGKQKLDPVFILPSDRNKYYDIKNKTKVEITEIIQQGIAEVEALGGMEESEILAEDSKEINKWNKHTMLSFHKRIVETIEMMKEKE